MKLIKTNIVLFVILISSPFLPKASAENLSLDAFLTQAVENSEDLKATELDIQSLKLEIAARDLELSPTLAVQLLKFWDNRPTFSSNPKTSGKSVAFDLQKPFATGTTLSLLSGIEDARYQNTGNVDEHLLNWQLGITQSLWQNSFGRQTSLRRKRDTYELRSRLLGLLLERQKLLVEYESLYWDLAYSREAVKIRAENLKRSQRILTWMSDRFGRSAAEHVDLLQAQALVSNRELQLQVAEDELKALEARFKERLNLDPNFSPDLQDLKKERELLTLPARVNFANPEPVLIETLQTQADADYLRATAKLEADKLNPILEVGYSYGQQGLNSSYSTARDQAFASNDHDYQQVGIVFSLPLDFTLINKSRRAARLTAQAQDIRSSRAKRESQIQWDELTRTVQDQKQRVQTALQLAKLQNDKSLEENARLEKGRTTVFQAINFEEEAAEGDLLALQLFNQLRRTEAQARIYVQRIP